MLSLTLHRFPRIPSPRELRRAVAGVVLAGGLLAPVPALAAPLLLHWEGAAGCSSEAEVRAEVAALLGRDPEQSLPQPLEVWIRVEQLPSAELRLELRIGASWREFRAARCGQVTEAAGLMVALAIDPEPPHLDRSRRKSLEGRAVFPAATPRDPPTQSPERRQEEPFRRPRPQPSVPVEEAPSPEGPRWFARLEGALSAGELPELAWGGGLALGLRLSDWHLELTGRTLAPQTRTLEGQSGRFQASAAAVQGCWVVLRAPLELAPCGALGLGIMRGEGTTAPLPGSATVLSPMLEVGGRLALPLLPWLRAVGQVGLELLPARARFVIRNGPTLEESALAAGRFSLGIELDFPW